MAKAKEEVAPATTPAATSGRGTKIFIKDPDTGESVARVDWIRAKWDNGNGMKRGDIARKLSEIEGRTVPYQTVFQATKPAKEEAAEGEAAPADGAPEAA